MPCLPSPAAHQSLRRNSDAALVNNSPALIILGGAVFSVAGRLSRVQDDLEQGGKRRVQSFHFTLPKASHPAQPALDATFTHDGKTFVIREVHGADAFLTAWSVSATRIVIPSEA